LTTSGFAVATSDVVEVCGGYTIGSFFGATAAAQVLTSGNSSATADTIGLWNSQANRFDIYYFNSSAAKWVRDGATATDTSVAADTVIPPGATIAITRQAGRQAVKLVQSGRVASVAPRLTNPGSNTTRYSGLQVPIDMTLGQVVLGSNWTKANSAFTADTLSVFNNSLGRWETFYQQLDSQWRASGSATNQDATVIPAGSAVAFTKRAAVSGSAASHPITLPYTP
jgi:hypothetical protein